MLKQPFFVHMQTRKLCILSRKRIRVALNAVPAHAAPPHSFLVTYNIVA